MNAERLPPGEAAQIKAAALLIASGALMELSAVDARTVVQHMRPQRLPAGFVLTREGETRNSDFMALLLDGEITVENMASGEQDSIVVSVLGPGSLIGEMGLIDGGPRSATCIAASDLSMAVLTRQDLQHLVDDHPSVACRLLLAMAKRLADHLRETNHKMLSFSRVGKALQQELDSVHVANKRLVDQLTKLGVKVDAGSGVML